MRQHFLRLFLAEDLRAHVGRRKADQPIDGHNVFFQLGDKRLRLLLFVRRADGTEPRVGRVLRLLTAGMRRDQVLRLLDNLFVHVDSPFFFVVRIVFVGFLRARRAFCGSTPAICAVKGAMR